MKKLLTEIVGMVLLILIIIVAVTTNEYKKDEQERRGNVTQEKLVTIGFSQVGAESDWRTANSISIKQTFTPERGYDLLFEDAKQKQSNQIMAIRRFIQQEVDYIVFSPVVENGWDTVLEEARRAGIPVIIIDRKVSVKDAGLYTAWIGSNFYLEGQKACKVLNNYVEQNQIPEVNIVNIQGTLEQHLKSGEPMRWKMLPISMDGIFWHRSRENIQKRSLRSHDEDAEGT